MNTREKLAALRSLMKKNKVDAYFIPSADPHQSEYLPEPWKYRAWLSGFTGSAGELVVGMKKAGLWTDGRYFTQADVELEDSGIDLMRMGVPGTPGMPDWVVSQLKKGQTLGIDPSVVSVTAAATFEKELAGYGVKVKFLANNLIEPLWTDRPESSLAPVVNHPSAVAGETVASKLKRVREAMAAEGTGAHLVCALDQIAWLLNIRSKDIEFTPVVTSYVLLTNRGCTLYVDKRKVSKGAAKALAKLAKIKSYDDVWADLESLGGKRRPKVWIDAPMTNRRVVDCLSGCTFHFASSPITAMKAVKNERQMKEIAAAHVVDGVAMVKFLKWLEEAVPAGYETELSASDKLAGFRRKGKGFKDLSFGTISGYAANGAIIHYSATEASSAKLKPKGLYLIDSGGQYTGGTTDITRTVPLGKPSRRQIECYTRVLMGTIDCTMIPFPAGTTGLRIEMFARRALWMMGEDYAHGTGHGVGQYLGVHEGPHSLKNIDTPPLVKGNLLSIEPGHYEVGKFGIRIEHLAFVVEDEKHSTADKTWYTFNAVTMCPINTELVNKKLMTSDQIKWLNDYHKKVYAELSPLLDKAHQKWLKKATKAI
jgi:Xaa-Pro aminopeptidase